MRRLFVGALTIFLIVQNEDRVLGAEGADFEMVSKFAFLSEIGGEKDKLCWMANPSASLSGHGFELKSARYAKEIDKSCSEIDGLLKGLLGTGSAFPIPAGSKARMDGIAARGEGLSGRYGEIAGRARNVYHEGMAQEAIGYLRQASLLLRKLKIEVATSLRKQQERRAQIQKVYDSFYRDLYAVQSKLSQGAEEITYDLEAINEDYEANSNLFEDWLTREDLSRLDQVWAQIQKKNVPQGEGPKETLSEDPPAQKKTRSQPVYAPSPKEKCKADCMAEGAEGSATQAMCLSICDNMY